MDSRFVLPFDPVTRQTTVPVDENGNHLVEASHASHTGIDTTTVICYVRGPEVVIKAMKLDPAYLWLEDVEVQSAEA